MTPLARLHPFRRILRKALPGALLAVLLAGPAPATTVAPISLEELARRASLVVEARALEQWSRWDEQQGLIYTYTRFAVSRSLKGRAPSSIVVRQMGGTVGPYTQKVSGVRPWLPGEESVLFLRPATSGDGALSVVGLMQGNFRVYRDPGGEATASNGVPDTAMLRGGKAVAFGGARLPLRSLEQRVRQAVTQ